MSYFILEILHDEAQTAETAEEWPIEMIQQINMPQSSQFTVHAFSPRVYKLSLASAFRLKEIANDFVGLFHGQICHCIGVCKEDIWGFPNWIKMTIRCRDV